jgi:hypothetical protein
MAMTVCISELSDHSEDERVDASFISKVSLKECSIKMATEATILKDKNVTLIYIQPGMFFP